MEEREYNGVVYVRSAPNQPWRRRDPSPQGVVLPAPPQSPTAPYEGPQAAADVERTQTDIRDTQADNAREDARMAADLFKEGLEIGPDGRPGRIENWTPPAETQEPLDPQKLGNIIALQNLMDQLQAAYAAGPGSTKGIYGLSDYLPTESNDEFNTLAASLGDVGFAAFRVPGSGANSDTDQLRFINANTPTAGDRDTKIETKLANVQNRIDGTLAAYGMTREDLRAHEGQVAPPGPSAFDVLRTQGGQQERAAGGRNAMTETVPVPPAMAREHDMLVNTLMSQNGGRLDPQAYATARSALDQKYGRGSVSPTDLEGWANSVNQYLDAGGKTVPTDIEDETRVLSMAEFLHNNLASNPGSAAFINAGNAAAFGAVDFAAPDQMRALRDAQPIPSMLGEIGGAIAGTKGLGMGGGMVAGRIAPALLKGGAKAQLGRNLATDIAYGTVYGAARGDDPLTSAALSGGGSLAGQLLGKGVGTTIGGLSRTPAAQALMDRGVALSVGRQLGDATSRAEDLLQSVPFVGGQVRARMGESFDDFNRAALGDAGGPIGFTPTGVGRAEVDRLGAAAGQARNNAMAGNQIPLDAEFLASASNAVDGAIPTNMRGGVEDLLGTRLNRIMQDGELNQGNYGITMSNLKGNRSRPSTAFQDYEPEFRNSVTNAMGAIDDLVTRSGNGEVIGNIGRANTAYRDFKTLSRATDAAKAGSKTGEVDRFAPSDLKAALVTSHNQGYGQNPALLSLANTGQGVLPSTVPNSGSADRLMAASLLPGSTALGLGSGYAIGQDAESAYTGGGLLAALALLGTRRGQQLVQKALIDRPDMARRAGRAINTNRGLFGSGMVPVALQGQ